MYHELRKRGTRLLDRQITLSAPQFRLTVALLSCGGIPGRVDPARCVLGYGGSTPPMWWGHHESSHCHHGMWLHGCGVFRVHTEPELP
jgi:hypothetical protein